MGYGTEMRLSIEAESKNRFFLYVYIEYEDRYIEAMCCPHVYMRI